MKQSKERRATFSDDTHLFYSSSTKKLLSTFYAPGTIKTALQKITAWLHNTGLDASELHT